MSDVLGVPVGPTQGVVTRRWRGTKTVYVVTVGDHVLEILTVFPVVSYASSNVRKDHNLFRVTFSDSTKIRVRMSITRSTTDK